MSKQYTDILSCVRVENPTLFEIIQDLLPSRVFTPKKDTTGITFLIPEDDLVEKIKGFIDDKPEELTQILQSLILLDYIPKLSAFDDRKSDIPTFLKRKLPVVSYTNGRVCLSNGAEITPIKCSIAADNLAVYALTKNFVPTDTEKATFANVKLQLARKSKNNTIGDVDKTRFFSQLIRMKYDEKNYKKTKDPFLAAIVSMAIWAKVNNKELFELIREMYHRI